MIKQSLTFNKILEKKFKILRTSIMLGNFKNKTETLEEFEDTAREIDKIRTNIYEEQLASKMYTTVTLEEERERLEDLVSFVEKRVNERNNFVDDYIKITSNFLDGLDKISLEDDLSSYKVRYDNIVEYLNNCEEIKKLNLKLKELRTELEEKYENKSSNEIINSKLEDELIEEFNRVISRNSYYSELDYTDIDLELAKIEESIVEKKSVLDTFASSYQALVSAGISGAEREEYSSYVQEARMNYYEDIEKKFILNIYKLVLDKQVDYDRLYEKRLNIENIINDREFTRKNLGITRRDELEYFINVCREQFNIIKAQKFNIESIDRLILEISDCENKLNDLENANKRIEIVEILEEFSVDVNIPEVEDLGISNISEENEDIIFTDVDIITKNVEKKPSNMVVKIKDPLKINVKSASDTAKLVMKKVVIVLEPKKFNKRDKLKEAELELKEENTIKVVKEIENDNLEEDKIENNDLFLDNNDDSLIFDSDNNKPVFDDNIFLDDSNIHKESSEVINTIEDVHDIFLDDDPDELGIQLDTKEVLGDSSIIETKELTQVKFNANDTSNMVVPTEIFIEEPQVEEIDLFKVTDPFLDDNEFEINSSNGSGNGEIRSIMPSLGRIGTVKPNNALSKIENVVKESSNVTLPNLGLVDGTNKDVPIVGENYIG